MSHAIAETSLGSDRVIAAAHMPMQQLAEDGEAIRSADEASASGIATIWLVFYALIALVVVVAN